MPSRDAHAQFALKPLAPEGGWPLNYAYLIKTSAPLADIYPIMGELLFSSYKEIISNDNGKRKKLEPPNAIYVAIDDDYELLMRNLVFSLDNKITELEEFTNYIKYIVNTFNDNYGRYSKMLFFADTFGDFGKDKSKIDHKTLSKVNTTIIEGKIAGSGNPMKIYKFIDEATQLISNKIKQDEGKNEFRNKYTQNKEGNSDHVHSSWNVYLINSLTSMYRNLGLGETVALLRMVLKKMWEAAGNNNDGILFAIFQDGVMKVEEQKYIESFFDGIIRIENKYYNYNEKKKIMIPSIAIEKSFGVRNVFPENLFLPLSMEAPCLADGKPAKNDWKEAVFTKNAPAPQSVECKQ